MLIFSCLSRNAGQSCCELSVPMLGQAKAMMVLVGKQSVVMEKVTLLSQILV